VSKLQFSSLKHHEPGVVSSLLHRSYQELVEAFPEHWSPEQATWDDFDRTAFDCPDTVGACTFVTCLGGEPVGLGSFNPTKGPGTGEVGHNCILPGFRKRGFGKRQLDEIVRRLRGRKAERILATTSEHPFFLPAREMYLSFGFKETGRREGGPDPGFRLVDYEFEVTGNGAASELDDYEELCDED